jgi:hypothetical protein
MAGKNLYQLTPDVQQAITAYIRAGGFPHVAAEAAGIPRAVFERWLEQGKRPKAKPLYRMLHLAVLQARAQARLAAEMAALKDDPLAWLKSGPGRETAEGRGWTVPVKPVVTQDNRTVNVLLEPQLMGLFAAVLQVLAPFPEARKAVAEALAGMRQTQQQGPPLLPG